MRNKISSIIVSPIAPKEVVPNVGYVHVDAQGKSLTIYDDHGGFQKLAVPSGTVTSSVVNDLINNKLANFGAFKFKGTVATRSNLPSTASNGDVYRVTAEQTQFAWNGTQWVQLGFNLADLNDQLNTKAGKATTLSGYNISDAYTKEEIQNKHYLSSTCSPIPDSVNIWGTTLEFCNDMIDQTKGNAKVGMMFMGTTYLTDVPLDLEREDWQTTHKTAEILITVVGNKILKLELTSTSYGERNWISMYNNGHMQYGDAKCPWFVNLLAPVSGYNQSTAHERILYKQFRGATEQYVDDKLSGVVTAVDVQQMLTTYIPFYTETDPVFSSVSGHFVTKTELPGLVSSLISGYVQQTNKNTAMITAISGLLISKNIATTIELNTAIDHATEINYENFDDLLD